MRGIQVFTIIAMLVLALAPQAEARDRTKPRGQGWLWSKAEEKGYRARETVAFDTAEAPGTVIIDSPNHRLYLVLPGSKALRYSVGVGREGYGWSGIARIARRAEWPAWYPPPEMVARAAKQNQFLPFSIDGGPYNPLGARALYLYQGKRDTLVRIHGTNEPKSIGLSVSSGCIRMRNEDIIDLYGRVGIGTRVVVKS
jgi:lipoprotein-anchoring transpeptidase ErfK/SrfK